jgi:hypothetical protein
MTNQEEMDGVAIVMVMAKEEEEEVEEDIPTVSLGVVQEGVVILEEAVVVQEEVEVGDVIKEIGDDDFEIQFQVSTKVACILTGQRCLSIDWVVHYILFFLQKKKL